MSKSLGLAALLLAAVAVAQPVHPPPTEIPLPQPQPTMSELRRFLEQTGRVLVTRQSPQPSIPIQGGGSLMVSGIGAFEPGYESQRLLGLRVDLDAAELEPEERVAYLDLHEVETLLGGMASLELVASEGGRGLETEAHIVGVEGFGLGVWVKEGKVRYQVRVGRDARVLGRLTAGHFATLREHIERARDRLFNAASPDG